MSLTSIFTDIANAIRAKTGKTATMTPAEMADEIIDIPTGDTSLITKILYRYNTFSEDSAFDVDFSQVGYSYIKDYALYNGTSLRYVTIPDLGAQPIGRSAFENCQHMELTHDVLKCGTVANKAFYGCYKFNPKEIIASRIDTQGFGACRGLICPAVTCSGSIQEGFKNSTGMTRIWINKEASLPASYQSAGPFYGCSSLADIYTDAEEQPSTWGQYFSTIGGSSTATVHYGVSKEEFLAMED